MGSFQIFSKRPITTFAAHFALSGSIILIQKLFFSSKPLFNALSQYDGKHSKALSLIQEENHHKSPDLGIDSLFLGFVKELFVDYQLFLLLAFFTNIIIPRILSIKAIQQYLPRYLMTNSSSKEVISQEPKNLKGRLGDLLISVVKMIISYSLIYVLFHLLWFFAFSKSLRTPQIHHALSHHLDDTRILEEKTLEKLIYDPALPPPQSTPSLPPMSLSIGDIRAVLDITAHGFILSHDGNTAFVLKGTLLRVLDMRIFHAPVMITFLQLTPTSLFDIENSLTDLLLSKDGKTLYYIHANLFEIIDVSNVEKPVLIMGFKYHKKECIVNSKSYRCNFPVTLSHDEKFLFLTRERLEIYDISNKTNPKLVNWNEKSGQLNKSLILSLAIGSDNVLYVADGNFSSYNISNFSDIKFIESYPNRDQVHQIHLSKDKKTLFLLSSTLQGDDYYTIFHHVNVSNPGSFKPIQFFLLSEHSVEHLPVILTVSPDENQFFIQVTLLEDKVKLVVLNFKEEVLWSSDQSLLPGALSMAFQSPHRIIAMMSEDKLGMLELSTNFPNKRISSLANNVVGGFNVTYGSGNVVLTDENKLIFEERGGGKMEMWDVSNVTKPVKVKTFQTSGEEYSLGYSVANKKLFVIGNEQFYVYNISSNDKSKLLKPLGSGDSWSYGEGDKGGFFEKCYPTFWKPTKDGNYLYILQMGQDTDRMKLEIKNTTDPKGMGATTASIFFETHKNYQGGGPLIFTSDQNLLFMMSVEKLQHVSIYNASNRSTIELMTSFPIRGDSYTYASLSHDDKTLFLQTKASYGYQLEIYNVTNLTNPELLSSLLLSSTENQLCLSSDSKTLYQVQPSMILILDVSDLKAPTISGLINLPYTHEDTSITLSPNGEAAFVKSRYENRVNVISITARYTLFFKREKFLLGERYKEDLMLLNFNKTLKMYDPSQRGSYKFIRSFLLTITSNQNVSNFDKREPYSISTSNSLPYWMNFNQENSVFSIEPQHENAMGNYTLCSGFSTQIPEDIFIQNGLFNLLRTECINIDIL